MLVFVTACTQSPTGDTVTTTSNAVATSGSEFTLDVDIPCSGHAQLILNELYSVEGVLDVRFRQPTLFDVTYDPSITSEDEIQDLQVFNTYPCSIV